MLISDPIEDGAYAESLPVYDEFPYLLTRLAPTLYHLIPLLDAFDESSLKSFARYQTQCNHLPTWLVLAENRRLSFGITGEEVVTSEPPCGHSLIAGQREAEVAISVFNALNDEHKEHPLGELISRRVMGWLTLKF